MAMTTRDVTKFPPIVSTTSKSQALERHGQSQALSATERGSISPSKYAANPFVMPPDEEIFSLRDDERKRKKEERERSKNLKVHEKTTQSSRLNAKALLKDEDDVELREALEKHEELSNANMIMSHDRHVEKENLAEFIAKKREMFLVQYSLGVKRDEMRKLEEIAQAEEQKLANDEKALEEDAAKFDAFLKENDKNSVEAIKRAEAETKAKMEKVAEIKKINAQIMAIKSEMSKNEDQLKEYQLYKEFLDKLTPQDWFEEKKTEKRRRKEERAGRLSEGEKLSNNARAIKSPYGAQGKRATVKGAPGKVRTTLSASLTGSLSTVRDLNGDDDASVISGTEIDSDDDDEEPELYFTDPKQLLDIFAELEEQNLSLIQNSQETEEALEELKQKIAATQERMLKETESLKQQIEYLEGAIVREEEKARSLEERAKFFSFGVLGVEDQEKELEEMNRKVEEVYMHCIGDNEANISTLQMLTNIENRLEELFEAIELMPPDKVEQAEKMKEKERRQRQREEKLEMQRIHQEERVKRALQRAKEAPRKKTGKPVMFRSAPPLKKKRENVQREKKNEEEEELKYYFT
eukprot:Opistho-2@55919